MKPDLFQSCSHCWVFHICWHIDCSTLTASSFRMAFPGGSAGKESACNAGALGSIPGLGRSPGEGHGYPLQYSGLENSMDCIIPGVSKSLWQQIQKTQQWPQDWKRSVFIPIPKKRNAKECSNYHTIALISYASKVLFNILQVSLGRESGRENWMKVIERYKLPVINQY